MTAPPGYRWLPRLYREIAAEAGLEATLGLARAKGGERVYVPFDARTADWLVQAMGEAGAAALVRMCGGQAIDLPCDPTSGQKERVRQIRRALDEGASANAVAARFGTSRRHAFWHKERMRKTREKTAEEPDLFTTPKRR